jgi:hypothetical protein
VYESDNDTDDDWSINDDVTHVSDSDGWSDAEDIFEFGGFLAEQPSVAAAAVQQGPRRATLEPVEANTENNLRHQPSRPAAQIFSRLATVGLTIPSRPQNYHVLPPPVAWAHPNLVIVPPPADFYCTICLESTTLHATTMHSCNNHHFHIRCLLYAFQRGNFACPLCRQQAPL